MNHLWQFWVDRGGTFTDIVAIRPDGQTIVHKLLSENPTRYADAPIQGMRELMGISNGTIPTDQIAVIKMGTTVATNALLERKGDRTVFITTQGFRDGLRIGYQHRPDIFARQIIRPEMLYEQVIEVPERMSAQGDVLYELTDAALGDLLQALQASVAAGITACAIALLHGDRYPTHEQKIAEVARQAGFRQVSVSHQVSPLIKWVSRGDTTVVDAYLSPILRRYVDRIESAFSHAVPQLLFMQSNGGLIPSPFFQGKDSILSGPAGGIVGAVKTSQAEGFQKIITFDMGGTSTDVAHFNGDYERVLETEVAGVRLRAPMMAIHTVAAGGGSILSFAGGRYQVGPASAGAYPGPACYRQEGPLTVTDCNVMLGKIQPQFFPQVFGPEGNLPIDPEIVTHLLTELAMEIATKTGDQRSPVQVAEGFLAIAIDNMANAIKKISVQRGYDVSDYALCCFGAAGGQHACRLAESLGIKTIFIHPYAGVLSAYGMGLADRRILQQRSLELPLIPTVLPKLEEQLQALQEIAIAALTQQGTQDITSYQVLRQLHLRYEGTDSSLVVAFDDLATMQQQFEQQYRQRFGVTLSNQSLIVATIAVEVIGQTTAIDSMEVSEVTSSDRLPDPITTTEFFSDGKWHQSFVYQRDRLHPGNVIFGPALILEVTGTNVIEPGWQAEVRSTGGLVLTCSADITAHNITTNEIKTNEIITTPDPVRLEIFSNLFQSIAEQMGFTLQNTSSSVNIKERLDFSCAIFDRQGQLVANAPHIPVHLGSMGESVMALMNDRGQDFQPGDVFISNNPYNGGTHLPDITAITPVFVPANLTQPTFFVASRGHHADIGGITPGSMPPQSQHLDEEGILFDNFQLIRQGELQTEALHDRLTQAPCPARNPAQNLADLQAQIAANNQGMRELNRMVAEFGLETVQSYMQHVQDNAEQAVRQAIYQLYQQHQEKNQTSNQTVISAYQVPMDCGATIQVQITLKPDSAILDFQGTSPQQSSNFNAPIAVCKAAVLYVFRTLVDTPIPLNAGCLKPLEIRVPSGCLLNPSYPGAVVAGNVETSQAVTDALYGALGVLAASQGTMNNFTFGNGQYQYYETICGGSGAGVGFAGTDAVQTHMTNSRLTDPEVLELRFPVLVESFAVRPQSGGAGAFPGGNGVIRRIQFREAMTANILAGRRSVEPFGLAGGQAGLRGRTCLQRQDGTEVILPATATVNVEAGDLIMIETPGGGGYGPAI